MMPPRRLLSLWTAAFLLSLTAVRAELKVTLCGEFTLTDARVVGLSGIAWAGGNQFYAASDRLGGYVPLTLELDPANGKISAGKIDAPVTVDTKWKDCEGIAWQPQRKTLWLSTEVGPSIVGCKLDGKSLPGVKLPEIYRTARQNLGLESLTCSPKGDRFWTASEETMTADGELPTGTQASLVRLQEFDGDWKPLRQFSWHTEPATMRYKTIGNGVSDLCLLPDGRLLVLERGFALLSLQLRLFLADFTDATLTSKIPSLTTGTAAPAKKTLLFQRPTSTTNYEGICLGPKLTNGRQTLVLVADSGSGHQHLFLTLEMSE